MHVNQKDDGGLDQLLLTLNMSHSCPSCNEEVKIEKLFLHYLTHHIPDKIISTFKCDTKLVVDHNIPYVFGTYKDDCVEGCLFCGKAYNGRTSRISHRTLASRIPLIKQNHAECIKEWADNISLYNDMYNL